MKRPMIAFSTLWAAGVYGQLHWNFSQFLCNPYVFSSVVAAIIFFATMTNKRFMIVSVVLAGFLFGALISGFYENNFSKPIMALNGKVHTVTATVQDFPDSYDDSQRVRVKISKNQLGGSLKQDVSTVLYLPKDGNSLSPGDHIRLSITWYLPAIKDGFDRLTHYKSEGVYILGSLTKDTTLQIDHAAQHPWWYYPKAAAKSIQNTSQSLLSDRQSGYLTAILIGKTSGLLDSDAAHMRKAGLSHVTSVSGLHIGFLMSFLLLFFGKRAGSALSVFVIVLFIVMIGWSPSVVRAGIMYIILAASFWFNRENDSLTALAVALLFILLINPYSIDSISLQLSFTATLGIILFSAKIQRMLTEPFKEKGKVVKWIVKFVASSLSCSLSSMVVTTPILLYSFGYISVLAPLANFLILWAVAIVFPAGLIMCSIYPLVPLLAQILCIVTAPLIDFILYATDCIAGIPVGLAYGDDKLCMISIVLFYVLFALMLFRPKVFEIRFCFPIIGVIIIFVTWNGVQEAKSNARITFLPSGYGQAITVSAGKQLALIDCSGSGYKNMAQDTVAWMDWWGYDKIELLILTSVDKTHARNVPELIKTVPVKQIIIPPNVREKELYQEIISTATSLRIPITVFRKKGEYPVGSDNLGIHIIGGVDRKLAVRIQNRDNNVLVLHSFTQKMQQELLSAQKLTADTLVLSQNALTDQDKLKAILKEFSPKSLILETNYEIASKLCGIPVQNTCEIGEISLKSKMITNKEQ